MPMLRKFNFYNYKNLFLPLLVLGFFSVAFFAHAAVVVTAPASGVIWSTGTTQTIRWTDTSGCGTATIQLTDSSGSSLRFLANGIPNAGSASWVWSPIPFDITTGQYRIYVSEDCTFTSGLSAIFTITNTDTVAPSTPTNFTATPHAGSWTQIDLSWTASTDTGGSGLAGYRIYRDGVLVRTQAGTSYSNTGLTPGTTYSYTVLAYDNSGNVSGTASASASTPADITPPTVAAPTSSKTSGNSTVATTASDNVAVAGVQFKVDGNSIGAEDTTSPYSVSWDTTTASSGAPGHTLTAVARDASGNITTSAGTSVTLNNSAPTACSSIPSNAFCGDYYTSASPGTFSSLKVKIASEGNASTPFLNYNPIDSLLRTRCGQTTLCAVRWQGNWSFNAGSYTFSVTTDDGMRLYIDGVLSIDHWIDQPATTYTYTKTFATAGTHLIKVEYYQNGDGAIAMVGWALVDATPPTVSITAPAGGSNVSGTITVSANASDNVAVAGVQFKVDGSNIGVEDTSSPYSISWDTTTVANGSHTLTAVARDTSNNTTTSAPVAVSVSNLAPDTTPPSVPTGLAATPVSSTAITVSWNASTDPVVSGQTTSGVKGYHVYRNGAQVGNVTSGTSFTDSGLSGGTLYSYTVDVYDNAGNTSSQSGAVSQSTLPPPNVSGYAWAGSGTNDGTQTNPGIGWVHLSGTAQNSDSYGVLVAADGTMSGYAWADPNDSVGGTDNIGWINFNPPGPYPASSFVPAQSVRMNRSTGIVSGWARAVTYGDGWDGWIGFGSGGNYTQPVLVSGCNWSGYAWGGGTVIGWIHFNDPISSPAPHPYYQVTGSGNGCALPSFDYSLSNSGNITVNAGASGSNTITSILVLGTTQGVTLSASGLPAGASPSFTNNPCSPNCTSQLTITTSLSTPGGTFPITVTGNPMGRTTSFNLMVNAAPPPPASVSATAANACKIINVSWNSSIGVNGYNVGRCVGAGCDQTSPSWTPLGSMVSGTSFQDTTASDGVTYRYGVAACFSALLCSVPSYSGTAVNNAPEVTFTYTPFSNIVINQMINFVGNLVGGVAPNLWSWTFASGNPATANTQNSSSSFSTAGSHAVQLTAANANGSCVVLQSVSVSAGTGGEWCELPPDAPPGTPCP